MRIGHGYDVHPFEEGDHLMLCGVEIPHHAAFKAHSDGDVAIHALCDALLGAAALGDIGGLFPDHDPQHRDRPSRHFLQQVVIRLQQDGYRISNVDLTIIAQRPRLAPHIARMRTSLAHELGIEVGRVSVKATTTERLGFVGREEGVAVHAVALLLE